MQAKIVILVEEGLVQDVQSNLPIDYVIVDRDVEGYTTKEIIQVPRTASEHSNLSTNAHRFSARARVASVDPNYVDRVFHSLHR